VNAKSPFQIVFTDRGGLGFEAFEGQETIKDQAQKSFALYARSSEDILQYQATA
jgi:hypothetical protein